MGVEHGFEQHGVEPITSFPFSLYQLNEQDLRGGAFSYMKLRVEIWKLLKCQLYISYFNIFW